MQRPQEREKKQEDRAELLVRGVHRPLSLPLFPFQLSLGICLCLSILPLFDPHMCTSAHTTKHT